MRQVGLVRAPDAGPTQILLPDGRTQRLVPIGERARHLGALDGFLVEVDGQRVLRRVRVADFRVIEGPTGFPVWLGPVQVMGLQVGVMDRFSEQLYWLDDHTSGELRQLAGAEVAIEGYVDGPHRVVATGVWVLDE